MRNNRFYVYILGLSFSFLLIFISCSGEGSDLFNRSESDGLLVNLPIDVPMTTSKLRSMSSSNEEKIETINVLVFTKDNSSSSEIFSYLAPLQDYASNTDQPYVVVKLRKTFDTQTARVVIVANIDINVRDLQGKTKDEAMELLTFDSVGKWKSVSESDFRALPMWSESDSRTISSDTEFPTFKLLRSVARIDVGLNFTSVKNGYESATGVTGYALKEVYLYRSLNKGYVAPSSSVYVDGLVYAATVPSSASVNDRIDYTELSDTTKLVRSIYTVEHLAGDADTSPVLVVGLEHQGRTTYYRINFTDDSKKQLPFLRNHRYVMNIKSVYGLGTDNPDAALINNPSNLNWEMSSWDESIKDIYISGDYYIGIDREKVEIDHRVNESSDIFIQTNIEEQDITLSWEDSSQSDYDVSFDYSTSKITVTANNLNSHDSNRPQFLHIKSGSIDIRVSVTQKKADHAYQIICSSVQINGKYVYDVPMDESNTITLTIRGTNEDIVGYGYDISTNTVEGVTFSAKGVFDSQTENVTLQATGTPINVGSAILPFVTNSSLMDGCSATLDILIPKKKILGISYTYSAYAKRGYATQNSGSSLFMGSENNFGSESSSIVKVDGLDRTYMLVGNGDFTGSRGEIIQSRFVAQLEKKPDIIIIGFTLNFKGETTERLIQYLNDGGVVIMFNEIYPFYDTESSLVFMKQLFSGYNITAKTVGVSKLSSSVGDIDDDITNGPFVDMKGKFWGNDTSTGSSQILTLLGLPEDQINVYSRYNGNVLMFRHKTLNLIWIGDGGFISNNNGHIGTQSGTGYPFSIDASYSAIPNTAYNGGTIYNSQLFGNIMSWAIRTAHTNGINTK